MVKEIQTAESFNCVFHFTITKQKTIFFNVCVCVFRVERTWLFHRMFRGHMGSWLQLYLPVCKWSILPPCRWFLQVHRRLERSFLWWALSSKSNICFILHCTCIWFTITSWEDAGKSHFFLPWTEFDICVVVGSAYLSQISCSNFYTISKSY